MKGDFKAWLFEEQWQVDWLRTTALLAGYKERVNGNFLSVLYIADPRAHWGVGEIIIYLQDPLPNATVDKEVLGAFIPDFLKREAFIAGDKDAFFA